VRDFSFSPDTGAISRIIYDDFGLSFLPVAFFDTYSIPMSECVLNALVRVSCVVIWFRFGAMQLVARQPVLGKRWIPFLGLVA